MNVMLVKDIAFDSLSDGKFVTIKKGTIVYFDVTQGIAYSTGNHFWLEKNEYAVLN